MKSSTEVLRELLDERGVEYRIDDAKTVRVTKWEFGEHSSAMFTEYDDGECVFVTSGHTWIPEQAIAATLGRGMLTADDVRDLIERHSDASGGNGRDFHNGAYVAIADELNATLGSCNCSNNCTNGERTGTCHADETDRIECGGIIGGRHYDIHIMECSACGGTYEHVFGDYEYCPHCRRRVVEVDA